MIRNLHIFDSAWNCILNIDFTLGNNIDVNQDFKSSPKEKICLDENFDVLLKGAIYSIKFTLNKMIQNESKENIKINNSLEIEMGNYKISLWESATKIKLLGIFQADSNFLIEKIRFLKKIYDEVFIPFIVKNPFTVKNSNLDFNSLSLDFLPHFSKEIRRLEMEIKYD
jgi:hypothetical protein